MKEVWNGDLAVIITKKDEKYSVMSCHMPSEEYNGIFKSNKHTEINRAYEGAKVQLKDTINFLLSRFNDEQHILGAIDVLAVDPVYLNDKSLRDNADGIMELSSRF